MQYTIGQLTLGQILDQSVTLLKNHFKLFVGITLIIYGPAIFVQSLLEHMMTVDVDGTATSAEAATAAFESMAFLGFLQIIVGIILLLIISPLTLAAMTFAVGKEYLDKPTTIGESLKNALSQLWPVLKTGIISGIMIILGFMLFIIPGIYLTFKYYIAQQVVVLEGVSGWAALKRSGELMKGNMMTAFALGVLLFVILMAGVFVVEFVPLAAANIVLTTLVQTIIMTFWFIAAVVFYFHCRAKNENYDLTLLAESVGEDIQEPGQPAPAQMPALD